MASQSELVAFAMRVLGERVLDRITSRSDGTGLDGVTAVCCEVLRLDAERMAEAEVWVELMTRSRTDHTLRPVAEETHAGLRALAGGVVAHLLGPGATPDHVALEAERLHALLDGLALHGVHHPGGVEPDRVRALVRAHLGSLTVG